MEESQYPPLPPGYKPHVEVHTGKNLVLVSGYPARYVTERADSVISQYKDRVLSVQFIPTRMVDAIVPDDGLYEYDQILIRIRTE